MDQLSRVLTLGIFLTLSTECVAAALVPISDASPMSASSKSVGPIWNSHDRPLIDNSVERVAAQNGPVHMHNILASQEPGGPFAAMAAPQGTVSSSNKEIQVIELPLPAALPLFAMGLAALLIFAHRPRHR